MATHLPVNHRMRGFYRFLAGLAALYCLVFGIVGLVSTGSHDFFGIGGMDALGLRTNTAFSVLSIVFGAVILAAVVVGRNLDHRLNLIVGPAYLVVGILMLALMDSHANFLNFEMSTCIVSFVIGCVLLTSGLYGRVGPHRAAMAEEGFRHSRNGDPHEHRQWGNDPTRTFEGDNGEVGEVSAEADAPASASGN
jgi:uncharacterized membrane protein YczE